MYVCVSMCLNTCPSVLFSREEDVYVVLNKKGDSRKSLLGEVGQGKEN